MKFLRLLALAGFAFIVGTGVASAEVSDAGPPTGGDASPILNDDGGVDADVLVEAPAQPQRSKTKITIATKQAPPFAMKSADGRWSGLTIELWDRVADELDLEYEIVESDIQGMVEGLESGRFDAAVAAMTVTADRESSFDFTHPFYTTGLGIAVGTDATMGMLGAVAGLFSWQFVRALGALLFVLLLVGIVVWLFERKKNAEQFGGKPLEGIGAGFWWSAVTMTTVGYGDKAPATIGGRFIGLIWMFVSIITISGFTAGIASALTVSQLGYTIEGPEDLPRVSVGSIDGTTSAHYLRRSHVSYRSYETPEAGLRAIEDGEIDAMVYDAPILRYFVNRQFDGRLRVLGQTFERQDYAIGLPPGSQIREPVNRILLRQIASDWWSDTIYNYLGR